MELTSTLLELQKKLDAKDFGSLHGTERDRAVHQMRIDIHRAIKKDLEF